MNAALSPRNEMQPTGSRASVIISEFISKVKQYIRGALERGRDAKVGNSCIAMEIMARPRTIRA